MTQQPDVHAPGGLLVAVTVTWSVALGIVAASQQGGSSDLIYQLAVWPPVFAVLWRVRRRGVELCWRLMALGIVLFALGDVAWDLIERSGASPDASWADLVYLSGYLLLGLGVALVLRDHGGPERRNGLIDGILLAVPAVVLVTEFLVVPGLAGASTPFERLVAAGYPLADTLLVAAMVWLLVTPGLSRRAVVPLAVGMGVTLVVDVTWAVAALHGADGIVRVADAAFPLTYVLLAVGVAMGATEPVDEVPDDLAQHVPWGRVVLLAAGLVASPMAAVLAIVFHDRINPVLVVGATLVAAWLVVVRFVRLVNQLNRTTEELTEARNEILEQSVRDPLTGLYNRVVLPERLAGLGRGGRGDALLCIDLDRFKAVNDLHGHQAGDAVLEVVAERLFGCTREADAVIRMGGDEFLVVAHDVDAEAADDLAHRVVRAVERPIPFAGVELEVSASVGVALVPPGSTAGPTDLLHHADAAMYGAKRGGGGDIRLVHG